MSDDCEFDDDADDHWGWSSQHEDYEHPSECTLTNSTNSTNSWPTFPEWRDLFSSYVRFRLVNRLLHAISLEEPTPSLALLRHCSRGDRSVVMMVVAQRSVTASVSELRFSASWYNTLADDYAKREFSDIEAVQAELRNTFGMVSAAEDDTGF